MRFVSLVGEFLGEIFGGAGRVTPSYPDNAVRAFVSAWLHSDRDGITPEALELPIAKTILQSSPDAQVRVLRRAIYLEIEIAGRSWSRKNQNRRDGLRKLISALVRRRLPYRDVDFQKLFWVLNDTPNPERHYLGALVAAVERYGREAELSGQLMHALSAVRSKLNPNESHALYALAERLDLLTGRSTETELRPSVWASEIRSWLKSLEQDRQIVWTDVLRHARSAAKRSRPSDAWLAKGRQYVEAVGRAGYFEWLLVALKILDVEKADKDPNIGTIRALIWLAVCADEACSPVEIRRLAAKYYEKGWEGAHSTRLGNACVNVLGILPDGRGATELFSLRAATRNENTRKLIDEAIDDLERREGRSFRQAAATVVPDHGLDATGRKVQQCGEYTSEFTISPEGNATIQWHSPDGKTRRVVPKSVPGFDHDRADKLKEEVAAIRDTVADEVLRVEALYADRRGIEINDFRERYLSHPITGNICRRLVWNVDSGGKRTSCVVGGDRFRDLSGVAVDQMDATSLISLWHPMSVATETVMSWRENISQKGIVQPFPQTDRQIFLLTDVERGTAIYSNRFAGQLMFQFYVESLCRRRGWRFTAMRDGRRRLVPAKAFPDWGLVAEFRVDPVIDDSRKYRLSYMYLSTGAVEFRKIAAGRAAQKAQEFVPLEDVPPILFSEVMRDVGKFSATSIAGVNPLWSDRGPGALAEYTYSDLFGRWPPGADERRAALARMLPGLQIGERCTLADEYLVVRGNRHTYRIHLGCGIVMIWPRRKHLCIVPSGGGSKHVGDIIPAKEDRMLSLILSKALLLAADDEITDESILSQL